MKKAQKRVLAFGERHLLLFEITLRLSGVNVAQLFLKKRSPQHFWLRPAATDVPPGVARSDRFRLFVASPQLRNSYFKR